MNIQSDKITNILKIYDNKKLKIFGYLKQFCLDNTIEQFLIKHKNISYKDFLIIIFKVLSIQQLLIKYNLYFDDFKFNNFCISNNLEITLIDLDFSEITQKNNRYKKFILGFCNFCLQLYEYIEYKEKYQFMHNFLKNYKINDIFLLKGLIIKLNSIKGIV